LIATSPEITIMPPHDGEDMAPTKRIDEAGDDDCVSLQTHERWTVRVDSGLRRIRVVDDASRWGSTAREREGTRYLGIPQKQPQWTVHGNPEAHASTSRDSPNIEKIGHRAALSDMGYEYKTAMTGNPLISRQKHAASASSTFCPDASYLLSFRPVSGCCGSKMGAARDTTRRTAVSAAFLEFVSLQGREPPTR
jgi:hypothetical protein